MKTGLKLIFLFFCMLWMPMSALASLPQYPDLSNNTAYSPNGYFEVFVKNGDAWQPVDRFACDKYFREQTVDLGAYLSGTGPVEVRLVQTGGGAAHIDSVFLGGEPPASAHENNTLVNMPKLLEKDFDVIDAFGKTFDCIFPEASANPKLTLTARVESETISKIPFQFPSSNLFKDLDRDSEFYTYQLTPEITGNPLQKDPIFNEFCLCGSGHPNGNTYGWVWNDDKNLYVYMDFTPDNTFDGLKDYAKVFVKTDNQIKEFPMSVGETRYGDPRFTYTEMVPYQHKVYPFTIPLSEISNETPETIKLAFAGYGTATPMFQIDYEVLLDTRSGGGDVVVEQRVGGQIIQETITGVDYRVGARVMYEPQLNGTCSILANVNDNFIAEWNGSFFLDPTPFNEMGYPITGRFGQDNTMAVEFYVPIVTIDNNDYDGSFTGVFHASMGGPNDYTIPFNYPGGVIPTMTEWGMLILAMVLMALAIWMIRHTRYRNAAISIVLVCFVVGIAWAATIALDGQTGDWSGIGPVVSDPAEDSSAGNILFLDVAANEDIRYGYVTSDNTNIYFRIDFTGNLECVTLPKPPPPIPE